MMLTEGMLNSWRLRISGRGVYITKECAKVKGYVTVYEDLQCPPFTMKKTWET